MDVSPWLLIEDSADSEGDSVFFSPCPGNLVANICHHEDDAESCTCETTGIFDIFEDGEGHDEKGSGEFCGDENESCGSDWNSSTMWSSDTAVGIECSSPLVVEDEVETRIAKVNVNDVEDKMFWEICMAVGYP
ncbi:hypothetical protein Fmac_009121 [Flemingia macrophylla]|uniref:Uncharacterized protein n=1 Tax=Flemingia macrophylla TaxID=520843 RepID=A0ABD1MZC3_9FABA